MDASTALVSSPPGGSRLPRGRLPRPSRQALLSALAAVGAFLVVGFPAGLAPTSVIAGAAGLVFVVLVLSDVTVGLMCFGALAFFENLPGVSGGVSTAKLVGTLVALSWFATLAVRPRARTGFAKAFPGVAYLALVFFMWTVASVAWATSPSTALTEVSRWGLNLLLLPIVFTALHKRAHMLALVGVLVGGATLCGLYGMVFAQSDALAQGTSRLSGAGVDANYLASLLVSGIVLALALAAVRELHQSTRVVAIGAALVMLVALVDTVSRGGMLGLGAALLVAILFAGPRRRAALLLMSATFALGIVVYYASFASPAARQRITSIQGGSGRTDIWSVGWRMVKAKPVTGVGAGNFANSTIHYLLQPGALTHTNFIVDSPKVAHNMYLEVLADLGIPGFALFLGVLGVLIGCGVRAARIFYRVGDQMLEVVSRGMVVAIMGILATDVFISDQFSKPLWIQLAMCPALLALARRMLRDAESEPSVA